MYKIQKLKNNENAIVVCDIDDTLYCADKSMIHLYKYVNGNPHNKIMLSTEEYAADPDAKVHRDWFDYSEFNDPIKVSQSLINGTPLLHNLQVIDNYVNAGYEFCFLTARGCEDAVKYAMSRILHIRKPDGKLMRIGKQFNLKHSAAINDCNKYYEGRGDAEKKANILIKLSKLYNYVVFIDDDIKNVSLANSLGLSNLTVIHAK